MNSKCCLSFEFIVGESQFRCIRGRDTSFPTKYPRRLLLILYNAGWCHPHGNAIEEAYAIPDYHVTIVYWHKSDKSDVCNVKQTQVRKVNQSSLHVHLVSTHLFSKTSSYLQANRIIQIVFTCMLVGIISSGCT